MPTKNRCHQFCSPQCALKGATSPRAIAPRTHRAGLPRAGGGRRPKPTASRLRRAEPSRALPPLTQAPNRRRAAHRPAASPRDGGTNGRQKPTALPLRCPPLPSPPRSAAKEEPRLGSGGQPIGAQDVRPAPDAPATQRASGHERASGLAPPNAAGRPPTKSKKNDGSTEAQKARGKTASRPQANRGPIPLRAAPARVRGGRPPRASERGGETAACQPAELTARGEPSASACGDLGHKWRAVDSPRYVTTQG